MRDRTREPRAEGRVYLSGDSVCEVRRLRGAERRETLLVSEGDFFLAPGRTVDVEGASSMTSTVTVAAHNADCEVRVLEGARSQPREVAHHTVKDGDRWEGHVWQGHWVEVKEATPH